MRRKETRKSRRSPCHGCSENKQQADQKSAQRDRRTEHSERGKMGRGKKNAQDRDAGEGPLREERAHGFPQRRDFVLLRVLLSPAPSSAASRALHSRARQLLAMGLRQNQEREQRFDFSHAGTAAAKEAENVSEKGGNERGSERAGQTRGGGEERGPRNVALGKGLDQAGDMLFRKTELCQLRQLWAATVRKEKKEESFL